MTIGGIEGEVAVGVLDIFPSRKAATSKAANNAAHIMMKSFLLTNIALYFYVYYRRYSYAFNPFYPLKRINAVHRY